MQPRRQPPPAPRPGAPLLALLLLLAVPAARAEGPGRPQDAGLPRGILQQAARAALHFFNFRAGSPSALRVLAAVQEGRAWVSAATRRGAGGDTGARAPAHDRGGGRATRGHGVHALAPPEARACGGGGSRRAEAADRRLLLFSAYEAMDFSQVRALDSSRTWEKDAQEAG
jgi:hypothetical protein